VVVKLVTIELKSHDVAPSIPMFAVLVDESTLETVVLPGLSAAFTSLAVIVIWADAGTSATKAKQTEATCPSRVFMPRSFRVLGLSERLAGFGGKRTISTSCSFVMVGGDASCFVYGSAFERTIQRSQLFAVVAKASDVFRVQRYAQSVEWKTDSVHRGREEASFPQRVLSSSRM
jgi:hypothetical protein